jgi:hypothetical protein
VSEKPLAVFVLTAFIGLQVIGASMALALGRPFLNYQPPYWRTLLIYGGGASYVSYLCWRQSPRARFATYIFLTVDLIRALRRGQWWIVPLDLVVLTLMQLPAFRTAFPSLRPADLMTRWRRRLQRARRTHGRPGADGSEPPRKGPGRFTPI